MTPRIVEKRLVYMTPGWSESGGDFKLDDLIVGDVAGTTFLPTAAPGENSWIQYEFTDPVTVKALTIVGGGVAQKTLTFRVEITDALKTDDNNLEIKVTNLWVNRIKYAMF